MACFIGHGGGNSVLAVSCPALHATRATNQTSTIFCPSVTHRHCCGSSLLRAVTKHTAFDACVARATFAMALPGAPCGHRAGAASPFSRLSHKHTWRRLTTSTPFHTCPSPPPVAAVARTRRHAVATPVRTLRQARLRSMRWNSAGRCRCCGRVAPRRRTASNHPPPPTRHHPHPHRLFFTATAYLILDLRGWRADDGGWRAAFASLHAFYYSLKINDFDVPQGWARIHGL